VSPDDKEEVARRLGAEIVLRSDRIANLKSGLKSALTAAGLPAVDAVGGDTFEGGCAASDPGAAA
jgi:NADPH:quinone reductase-like Zn-dependent oxidoreductase